MKCPKCMEKPLDWKVAVKNICPKCATPSCCGQPMLALNASKSEWKCLACGSKIGDEK